MRFPNSYYALSKIAYGLSKYPKISLVHLFTTSKLNSIDTMDKCILFFVV